MFERETEVLNIYTASFCTSGSLYARKAIAEGDGMNNEDAGTCTELRLTVL